MATITPLDPRSSVGVVAAPSNAAGGGDVIPMQPGKQYVIKVNNGGGGGITVSADDPVTGGTEYSAVPIAAGASRLFNFKRPNYGAVPTANIALTYSGVTTVTVEAYGPLN
jgi:hypothetical protein